MRLLFINSNILGLLVFFLLGEIVISLKVKSFTTLMNESDFVDFHGYKMHYKVFGNGNRPLLAFHGFGGSGNDWSIFEQELGNDFTLYAFDIFYHGESKIDTTIDEPSFGKAELSELVDLFMTSRQISRISLIGYSLGGKLCMCLIELLPGKIDQVFLMAPDGIKIGFWNKFVSQTQLGRMLFRQVVKNPKPALSLIELGRRTKLIPLKVDTFLRLHLAEETNRKRILSIWILFKDMIPDNKRIKKHITRYNINCIVFFGRYDLIIPLKYGLAFQKGLKKPRLEILECGHIMVNCTKQICETIKSKLT